MTATAHALIGASLAVKLTNPLVGIPIAFLSHFAADLVPHWDPGTNHKKKTKLRLKLEATADVLIGFLLTYLIFARFVDPVYLFVMIIAAQLPDWLEAPYFMFGIKLPPFTWFRWIGSTLQTRMQLPWGLVTQVVIVGLLIYFSIGGSNLSSALASTF